MDATLELTTLRQVAALAPGSTLAMTFLLPLALADPEVGLVNCRLAMRLASFAAMAGAKVVLPA